MTNKPITLLILISAIALTLFGASRINFSSDGDDNSASDLLKITSPNTNELITGDSNQDGEITIDDLEQGCPRRDCIPSIENPNFETVSEADSWLENDDLVFGVVIEGEARAYPQRILNWHEIVNDTIQGQDIAVTFCPLCGSALSFERKVNGQTTEFGVSGKLFNSNLVMYDRLEEGFWQQETGEAIIGPAAQRGERLKTIPMANVFWSEWQDLHPDSQILSRDTGYTRDYDRYPYGSYEEDGQLYFGIENTDTRLPLKAPGFGFEIPGYGHKFYQQEDIPTNSEITDTIGTNEEITVVIRNQDGLVTMETNTGEVVVPIRTFWFAFAAFHPDTEIYNGG